MRQIQRVLLVVSATAVAGCNGGSLREGAGGMAGEQAAGAGAYGAAVDSDIARVREATEPFRSLDAAAAAGYARSVRQCVAHPEHGAMGYHHANAALLDDRLEVERPEMLVYERAADGEYVLNGVEYIVPYSARSKEAEPPTIMGQKLKRADGLQLWYLHVWIWRENGAGLFADWNAAVECRA
jgi:hypothetical protein